MILHADMDAFYAAIEQRDRPELRGKPVVVGGDGPRSVVSTASYEARKFGVRSAMPGTVARRLCPHGVFLLPRMDVYAAVSAQVQAIFASYTPLVEPLSLDEAFLDVRGSERLFGDAVTIARAIQQRVRDELQLTVSVGVASVKFVAKVASDLRKPEGLVVVEAGTEREFLAPLPVRCLWGAGPVVQDVCARNGLATIGEVQRLSPAQATQLFGAAGGEHFLSLAHGIDPRSVEPDREAKSIGHETTFVTDLTTLDDCGAVLLDLSERVGRRLRVAGTDARTIRLKLRTPDFATTTRQTKLPAPTHDDLAIHAAAMTLLRTQWSRGLRVRLLGVTAADLQPAGRPAQHSLFEPRTRPNDALLGAIDAVRARFGERALKRGATLRDDDRDG